MTKPVDLDALDALLCRATAEDCLDAVFNAYPLLAAELRERRAREEARAAEIRALREVAEAAKAFMPTCERVMRLNGVCVG